MQGKFYIQRFSNTSFDRTLLCLDFGGLLLGQTFGWHSAGAKPLVGTLRGFLIALNHEPLLACKFRRVPCGRKLIIAYMIYSQICNAVFALEFSGTPNYRNMLGKFSPSLCFSANRRNCLKLSGAQNTRICSAVFLHKVFPGILQVVISNGMVPLTIATQNCVHK